MKVGLCWQGSKTHRNDANRSLPDGVLWRLALIEGVEWVALAKDAWRDELAQLGIVNGLANVTDWQDTAEVVRGLDLVISVDTAMGILTGSLVNGPPVWILIAAVPDQRWGMESVTTPWFDRARLYRQKVAGDWDEVLQRVASDLKQEVERRRAA